jgi:hypothetical protein
MSRFSTLPPAPPPSAPPTWWLYLLRSFWLAVVCLVAYTYTVGMPARIDTLVTIVPTGGNWSSLNEQEAVLLIAWGVPLPVYFWSILLGQLLLAAVSLVLSTLIVLRQPNSPGALICTIMIVSLGCSENDFIAALTDADQGWRSINLGMQTLATYLGLLIFYTFPDGRFVPRWTRWLALGYGVCMLAWLAIDTVPFNPLPYGNFNETPVRSTLVFLGWYATGVAAMVMRYRFHSTPTERRQTKWAAFGLLLGLTAAIGFYMGRWAIRDRLLSDAFAARFVYEAASQMAYWCILIAVAACFTIAILRHQLWDIDFVIRRTLLYTALSLSLAAVAAGGILIGQTLLRGLSRFDSELTAVLTTLLCVLLFEPLRRRLQASIDRRYDRTYVDFRPTLIAFSRELNQLHTPTELLDALLQRSIDLLKIAYGAIYLHDDRGRLHLRYGLRAPADTPELLDELLNVTLTPDREVHRPTDRRWPLLLPLSALRDGERVVIGALALGPRRSEESYSRQAIELLLALADRTGTAVSVADLVAYQLSPSGRAEALAQSMARNPACALVELHQLATATFSSANEAAVLDALPQALRTRAEPLLADLADGYRLIAGSRTDPALLLAGLRLIAHSVVPAAKEARATATPAAPRYSLYELCYAALAAGSLPELFPLRTPVQVYIGDPTDGPTPPLRDAVAIFMRPLQTLEALARVETAAGQLLCLTQAQEQLAVSETQLPATLDAVERHVARHVARHWMDCVEAGIRQIQGEARLEPRLLSGSLVLAPEAQLGIELRNRGQGPAHAIGLQLAPGPGYEVQTPEQRLDRLDPGDSAVVTFALQLDGAAELRPELKVVFSDAATQRTPQILRLQVPVLTAPVWRGPVDNPYIAGRPLGPGSRLFIGRDEELEAVRRILVRPQPNAVVLTGQRRMGKTSLLKQLAPLLQASHVTAFLDGQRLGSQAGLPECFAVLAARIAQALQHEPLPLAAFAEHPTAVFAEQFLPTVLEAAHPRRLLLLIDEVEALAEAGRDADTFFGYLRHLMQHELRVALVLAGAHRLETLRPVDWPGIFNAALHRRLAGLRAQDARTLIGEPLGAAVAYDALAVDQMVRLSGGHPYFLQLLCQAVIDGVNERREAVVLLDHVLAARESVLELGEAPLADLWQDSTTDERLVLTAAAQHAPRHIALDAELIDTALVANGYQVARPHIEAALQRLAWRDLLVADVPHASEAPPRYRWRLSLLRDWILHTQTLTPAVVLAQALGAASSPDPVSTTKR